MSVLITGVTFWRSARLDVFGRADDSTKELDDFAQGGGEGGDVCLGVVEVKTRAGGAGEAELFH